MDDFHHDNLDVLQNIEAGIIQVYRSDPSLLDIDAQDAIDALTRHYRSEEERRGHPNLRLGDKARSVFDSVQGICEWRLGRAPDPEGIAMDPIPVADLVACLREIQKSIPRWTQQGGRRGYLDFVRQYLP